MFIKNIDVTSAQLQAASLKRKRGRPAGRSTQAVTTKQKLYEASIRLFQTQGYETTTMRDIAKASNVSLGLLYRYFPSKQFIILEFYNELSKEYETRVKDIPPGTIAHRFFFALRLSLSTVTKHRTLFSHLLPVFLGPTEGIFSKTTAESRQRVQHVFERVTTDAVDRSGTSAETQALGRIFYLLHLLILLFWVSDVSENQSSTKQLIIVMKTYLPIALLATRFKHIRWLIRKLDHLYQTGLLGIDLETKENHDVFLT